MSARVWRELASEDRESPVRSTAGAAGLRRRGRLSGTRVGRFRLGARLGAGGAATVYLARFSGPHQFERIAAVKVIHEHLADEPEFVAMFLDEARLAARLAHPNVVHVYELGREGDVLFIAMEYLDGQPLSHLYRALSTRGGALPPDVLAFIGARVAEALHHAHQLADDQGAPVALVHRDVSPENVFVTYEGHVKVIDFGIARAVGRMTTTALGHIKGKYRYMAPEQALGRALDHRVDVFALGATLGEGVHGRPLFDGVDEADTLGRVLRGAPAELFAERRHPPTGLAPVLSRALAVDPDARQESAAELARDLDGVVQASGRNDQRERLAEILDTLFVEERRELAQAVAELRALDDRQTDDAVLVPAPVALPRAWRQRMTPLAVAGLLLVFGIVTAIALMGGDVVVEAPPVAVEPAATPPSPPDLVQIDVQLQPPVPARILVGGELVADRPARRGVPRGTRPVAVDVLAAGFAPVTLTVTPDRDRGVVVPLVKGDASASGERPPLAARAASSPSPTAEVATAATARTDPRPTGSSLPPKPTLMVDSARRSPAAAPSAPAKTAPGLVTEYPF
ncbi:MAG: serine/threonine protein kinase [Polyangiaceae bacterium]|nr:serine/threonine protein kinase [Polyangiaceae bacterium]